MRQKFIEILLTALLSAFLAFLQSLIFQITDSGLPSADPSNASIFGATFRYLSLIVFKKNFL